MLPDEEVGSMALLRATGFVGLLMAVWMASACTLASPTHITVQQVEEGPDGGVGTGVAPTSSSASPTAACSGAFVKADLSKLTVCGDGKGHCYDDDKTQSPGFFVPCPGSKQVCVPDDVLTGAGAVPKSCTSPIGKGGCINMNLVVIPDDQKANIKLLKQDVCPADEVCPPCTDPTHGNAPTPFCAPMGVFDKPCSAAGAAASDAGAPPPTETCCKSGGKAAGVCISETAVPEANKSQTITDTCSAGNVCVPQAFVSGAPTKCKGPLGSAGVCIDKCFSDLFTFAGPILGGDGCTSATEICVPCLIAKTGGQTVPGCE
jgi:hypothetical protein